MVGLYAAISAEVTVTLIGGVTPGLEPACIAGAVAILVTAAAGLAQLTDRQRDTEATPAPPPKQTLGQGGQSETAPLGPARVPSAGVPRTGAEPPPAGRPLRVGVTHTNISSTLTGTATPQAPAANRASPPWYLGNLMQGRTYDQVRGRS